MDDIATRAQAAGRSVYRAQVPISGGLVTDGLERYALGYVAAAFELCTQLADAGAELDEVWICSSEATQAGLVVGNLLLGSPWRIVGVSPGVLAGDLAWRPSPDTAEIATDIAKIATDTLALLGSTTVVSASDIESIASPGGDAYGRIDPATLAAVHRLARLEGLVLDPVYTGKAMAALLERAAASPDDAGRGIVFFHTGGTQLLFAYGQEIESFLAST
jgi:1-aminocyclopropane-1-carboxylate deaminase/D-cysteine desulfhydrase-like pyridoxal-dependent ACC family enzyme